GEDSLAILKPAGPPQRLHALILGERSSEAVWEMMLGAAVQRVRLGDKDDFVPDHIDKPAVVGPPDERSLDPPALFLQARRNLDVAGSPHTSELAADPQRIAHVLKRVRADHEVDLVIAERERLAVADVALDPRLGAEALGPLDIARRPPLAL